jgi:hypothetical protein
MNFEQKKLIESLHKNDITIQDILSVMYDLRPCIRYSLTPERLKALKEALPKLNLEMVECIYPPVNKRVCFIGKDLDLLENASMADQGTYPVAVGEYLGYPSCCIEFWLKNKSKHANTAPILVKNNSSRLDYRLNFILNFDSKVIHKNDFASLDKIIGKYRDYDKFIVPHMVCSFDCAPSLKYATALADIIKKEFPSYFQTLKGCLKKIFIFVDNFRFLGLEGEVRGGEIFYSQVHDFNTLFNNKIQKLISRGNKLKQQPGKILVFKNDTLLGEAKLSFEILDFQEAKVED